jgi:hypothetical protein
MDEKTFKTRTKKLAAAIIHQTEKLPSNDHRIYQDSSQSQIQNGKSEIVNRKLNAFSSRTITI